MSYELNRSAVITGCVNCFCLACGTFLLNREDAASHIVTVSHCENLSTIPYSDKFHDQYIRKFKSGYFCEFCNKLMQTVMHVNLHLVEEYHKDNRGSKLLQSVGNEVIAFKNIVINERSWHGLADNMCCLCVTEFEHEAQHKAETTHVLGLIRTKVKFGTNNIYRHVDESFIQCMTCNKLLSVNAMSKHFNDTDHISLYEKCKLTAHIENTIGKNTCENVIATNIMTRDFSKTERSISAILPYPDDEDKHSFEFKEVLSDNNNESSVCNDGPVTVVPNEHLEVTIQTNQNVHKFESNEGCSKHLVTHAHNKNTKVSPLIKNPDTSCKDVNEIEQNEFSLVNCNNIPESDVLDINEPSIQIKKSDAVCQNDNKIVHSAYSLIEGGSSDYNESHETMEYTNTLTRIKTSEAVCQEINKYETGSSVCIESSETDVRNKYMEISTQIKIPDVVREDVSKTVDYENSFLEKGRTYCICSPDTDLINENTVISTQIENPDAVCQDVNKYVYMCNENCFIERGDSDCSESPETDVVNKHTEKPAQIQNLDTATQDITFDHDEDCTFKSGNFDCNQNFGTDVPKSHSDVTTHTKYLETVCLDANKFELTKDPVFDSSTTNSETNEIYASNNNIHYKGSNKNSFCNICQVNIPSTLKGMKEHVEGGRHNKNILAKRQTLEEFLRNIIRLERTSRTEIECGYLVNDKFYISLLSQMLLVKNGLLSGLKCLICGVILPSQTLVPVAHIDSCCLPNSRKMPVLTYKEDEYIREIRPKLFHCGFCHIVASGWDEMVGHLKSSEHDRHKSEAYSEYRFIENSLETQNHRTIYNNGLLIHYHYYQHQ